MRNLYKLLTLVALITMSCNAVLHAQITVYNNTFPGTVSGTYGAGLSITSGTPAASFTTYDGSGFGQTGVQIGGSDGWNLAVASFTNNQLVAWVDGGDGFGDAGDDAYATAPLSTYSTPFTTTLSSNAGVVTWTFNIRTKTLASGFSTTTNNAAVVLAGTNATLGTSGNGYAVTYLASSSNKTLALVKYTGGIHGTVTSVVTSTSLLTTGTDYASVKVTYDPTTNTWNIYVRDDGTTAFANPATGVLTSGGSAVDATYTGTAMSVFGFYAHYHPGTGSAGSDYAYYDNFNVAVTCTAPTAVTAGIAPASVCSGSPLTLTGGATGATTYSWSGPGGYSSTSESPTISSAPIGSGGTYTFTAYTAVGCPAAATATVTVNTTPSAPVMSPTVAAVCNGGSVMLSAGVPASPPTVLTQNFNSGFGTWTVDNTGSSGTTGTDAAIPWRIRNSGFTPTDLATTFTPPTATKFAMTNSDSSGSGTTTETRLISPVFSLVGYTAASLTFTHVYESWGADVNVEVDLSTDGGATFPTVLQSYLGTSVGTSTSFATATISLTPYVGMSNLKIRYFYQTVWGFYWAIDDVSITGTPIVSPVPSWSPITYLYTDAGLTTPYVAGVLTNTVYAAPTGISTTTIETYTATASNSGCTAANTVAVTINVPNATISGTATICSGGTPSVTVTGPPAATVTYNINGGSTLTATIGAGGTVVLSTVPLYANTTYNLLGIVTGVCSASLTGSAVITVNPPTTAITGTPTICQGFTTVLSSLPSGGTWSSGGSSIASINSISGVATGVNTGTAPISYAAPTTGCLAVITVTVNPAPSPISATTLCQGAMASAAATETVGGGTWAIAPTSIATIDSNTGMVTGLSGGTAIVTYTLPAGCSVTTSVTIYPLPAAITGNTNVCQGLSTVLGDTSTTLTLPGTWSSSDPSIVSVTAPGSTSGAATDAVVGVSVGTAVVTYTLFTGCLITDTITVNPSPAPITGPTNVCATYTIPLSVAPTTGGTWSTGPTSFATIDPLSGVLTGLSGGTTIVTYTLPPGSCTSTYAVTVNDLPSPITGTDSVCVGLTTALSSTPTTGTWTAAPSSVATIDPTSGVVYGAAAGTSYVTYTLGTGCFVNDTVTVNPSPAPITGSPVVCATYTDVLSVLPTTGGTWSNSPTGFATIDPLTGILTGISAGSTLVTYTLPPGQCTATYAVTVNDLPSPISGPDSVCVGLTITLGSAPTTGTWTAAPSSVATIDPTSGVVYGAAAGAAYITYTLGTGCYVNDTIIVNPTPSPITGSPVVCAEYTDTLSDLPTTGGTWSNAPTGFATIDPLTGILTGISAGTTIVTYTLPAGQCTATYSVLVNPLPSPITGPDSVCAALTITLHSTPTTGTWTSAPSSVATIDPTTGIVTGIGAGMSDITYTLGTGCYVNDTVKVNPAPSPITGPTAVCATTSIALSDTPTTGGTWSTSPTSFATIDPLTGVLAGLSGGTTIVTYTLPPGQCTATYSVLVNDVPSPITGADSVCVGLTTALSSAPTPGTWSNAPSGFATIDPVTGILTGISQGVTEVTYTLPTGCLDSVAVRVNPLPDTIAGLTAVCTGLSITLTDDTLGGTWSATPASVGTISSSGILTGTLSGPVANTVLVTYTIPTGCIATSNVTVNPLPAPIAGADTVCYGLTTTLTDAVGPGTWSSSDATIASIDAGGTVTGVNVGSATITYTLGTGCIETMLFTVNPLPLPITGPAEVCVNASITMSDVTSPGTWSTAPTSIATINPISGSLTGVSAGTVTVIFTLPTSCAVTNTVTVDPIPNPIGGTFAACEDGGTAIVTETTPPGPGTWSITPAGTASISATGTVTGEVAGAATVTYTLPVTGCYVTQSFTVNPLPAPITGTPTVCANSTVTLHDATTPGTWSAAPPTVATISTPGGVLGGISSGTATVTYTLGTGCDVTYTVTVDPQPAAVITPLGDTMICTGSFVALTANTGAGLSYQWSDPGAIPGATASSYIASAAGNYKVKVTNTFGCSLTSATMNVSIHDVGPVVITSSGGATTTCAGTPLMLSTVPGAGLSYQWELNGVPIPGANANSYNVTDSSGNYDVVVSNTTGCSSTSNIIAVTVNPAPAGNATASGVLSFCTGGSVTLTADTGTGYTYQWYGMAAGAIGGANGISYTATTSDVYYVQETGPDGCNALSAGITVDAIAGANTTITPAGATVFCAGGSVLLTVPAVAGNLYQWYNGGTAIAGATNATYTDTLSGSFTVAITNVAGCTDTTATAQVVTSVPVPLVVPLTPASFCWGGGVTLTVNVVSGTGALTYQWYLDGTLIPGATSPIYNTSTPGDYTCTISGSCITATAPVTVIENPLPNPVISSVSGQLETGNYYVTYQWYENTVGIPGATTATITPTSDGNYAVAVTDTNGCQSVSDVYVLTSLGISNVNQVDVKIYPNPAQTMVHIVSSSDLKANLSSIDGKILISQEHAHDIDISNLADGVYMIMLYDINGVLVKTEKLIKVSN